MNRKLIAISLLTLIVAFSSSSISFAHPHNGQIQIDDHKHEPQTEYIPLNEIIGLEKTRLIFHASENNSLPWGFVEGKIANHVAGYPVIIQIYKEGEAVHFAQTDVDEHGTYEYKFRVLNLDGDKTTKLFEGNYQVTIFKVVYTNSENSV